MQLNAYGKGLLHARHGRALLLSHQNRLIMKLTTALLLVGCLQVSARVRSQTVTLDLDKVPLVTAFKQIQQQTGYAFVFSGRDLANTKAITIHRHQAPLDEVLQACLAGQPLVYQLFEKTIIIKTKPPIPVPAGDTTLHPTPRVDIHGRVTDSLGNPLPGASITIKGTNKGTKSNVKGEFDMKEVPAGTILVISYTGYANKEITGASQTFVVLHQSQDILDATIIQAYGTTSRRFNVGSISTVDAATIERQPVTNVLLALEGQVPGLAINATSGVPGSRVQLQIRGQNTIQSNPTVGIKPYDQPLFIVDGVPFAPQNVNLSQLSNITMANGFSGGISQAGGFSPFNGINPADIESISVLKDADATSIYGTQGSNGVILITTKKGKAGKSTFNLSANTGYNTPARSLKLMSTQQHAQMRKDAFAADGVTPTTVNGGFFTPGYAPDLLIFDQTKNTDWQKTIFGKTSNNTDIHGSLSGGSFNNTFLVSGGYTRSDYNFPGNYNDQRLSLHSMLHHSSADNRLTVDFGMDYSYDQNNSPGFGGAQDILLPSNLPDLMDARGNLVWSYKGVDLSSYQFYGYLKKHVELQNYNLNSTLRLSYKVMPGLTVSTNLGYSRNTSSEHAESPASGQNPAYANASASFATNNFQTLIVEPQIDYIYSSGKSVFTALAGGTYKKNLINSTNTQGTGYANDDFLGSINGATTIYSSDNGDIYKYGAGFARLKYVYDKEFIVSLTGRRDGSSNFGPGHQFGAFGSTGLGWIFSEEKAFKAALPFISYAKLSGSYGTSGSDGIASYQYQAFWTPLTSVPAFQGSQPDIPVNLYNPDYSWALKKSLNTALDIGFFHDRLLINATYYRDREGNQLGGYSLSNQVGLTFVLENLPAAIQNSGWEFSLNSTNIKTKDFSWTTNFNISFNRNKLIAFPNLATSSYKSQYVIGKSTSMIMGYRFKGLNDTTGLFEYYTKDGKVTNTPKYGLAATGGDLTPIGDREVKFMGGFGNALSYKHFSLYFFFQFAKQTAPNYLSTIYGNYAPGLSLYNLPVQALNYWKKPGDHAALQKLSVSYFSAAASASGAFITSSGAYSDDTYLRLKTMSLSWSLPEAFLKKMHIQNARIYANAQNLLTITNNKVSDPEQFGDFTSFPLQRTVVFGLNFNF